MPYLRYPMIHVKHATNCQTKWKCRGPVFRGPRARSSGSFRHNLILHLVFRFSPSSGAPLLCTIAFSISSLASLLVLLRSSRRGSVQVFVSPIQQLITNEVTLTGSGIHMRLPWSRVPRHDLHWLAEIAAVDCGDWHLHCLFLFVYFFFSAFLLLLLLLVIWVSEHCKALVCSFHWNFWQIYCTKLYL